MAAAGGNFSDEEFWEVCAELQQPAVAGNWELLLETSGISIYRLLEEQHLGISSGILLLEAKEVSRCINVFCSPLELYEKECDGETLVYWQVAYPFPMYNRDYVYIRQLRELDLEGRKIYVILAKSTSSSQFPERSGVIRVSQYQQRLAIESDGKGGSRVFMYYFDNPGGLIPSWLINWVTRNGVPSFLKDLEEAYHKYPKKK
uniref:Phosphatidylcholine transfer protein n=1 Tax=Spermophilus dauricus TaxID=99837 RepID=A0A8C9QE95_SPEDA